MERCKSLASLKSFLWRLIYLGPVTCSFPSWTPLGCTVGAAADGLVTGSLFISTLSSFKAHHWGRAAVWLLAWWLKHILFAYMASDIFHPQEHLLRGCRHHNSCSFRILKNVEMVVLCATCKLLREKPFLGTKLKKKTKNKKTVRKTERHQERERATHEQGVRRGLGGRQRGRQHMVTNAFPLVEHRPVSLSQHFFLVFAASSPAK